MGVALITKRAKAILLACVGFSLWPADTAAQATQDQWRTLPARVYININGGYQQGTSFTELLSETLYDETATYTSTHSIPDGTFFDGAAGVRFWKNLAFGVAVSSSSTSGSAQVVGNVPHPLFYSRSRTVTGDRPTVDQRQIAYHGQLTWFVPLTDKLDVAISGGPSIYSVDQQVLSQVTVNNSGERYDTASIAQMLNKTANGSGFGGNIGFDITYLFTDMLGGGLMLRWGSGSVELGSATSSKSIEVGGLQVGLGARVRF